METKGNEPLKANYMTNGEEKMIVERLRMERTVTKQAKRKSGSRRVYDALINALNQK